MLTVNPYLTFNGVCEAAFLFYADALGKPLGPVNRFGDMPAGPGCEEMPAEIKNRIMHVSLPLSEECVLMGSDTTEQPAVAGSNVAMSINVDSREQADAVFRKLSEGGEVTMPLQDTFWGAYFGMWTDKFGIRWMLNYDDPAKVQPH